MSTWKTLITRALQESNETWLDVEASTFADGEMDKEFDCGFGGSEGIPFTLWTAKRVYFPCVYDGAEWVGSAPRNPCDEKTKHQGGE